ncbi:GntR family transcriptional regulator [Neptunicella sp. SCSIO 80796]|uniref:GntR family transcriptional regulator n=1 Tax=Neptunicella plasticusilytica TaxID=3117012 RepID=UPI003A4D70A9
MTLLKQLKQDIQTGVFLPGEVLRQTELAARYQVSRIPVRDAISTLLNEGWLVRHGKAGVAVAAFDQQEVEDIYLMRMRLEPLILELAFPHLSKALLGQAEDLLDLADNARTAQQVGELNWRFHQSLYQCANRVTLMDTVNHLHQQCARYIGYQSINLHHMHRSQQEHRQMITALRQQNLTAANDLLISHIQQAGQLLVEHIRHSPEHK